MSRTALSPLYATEQEIAELVLGRGHFDEWKATALVLEHTGLPKIDPAFGRRYYPAVKQYFDRRNGIAVIEKTKEEFAWTRRRPDSAGASEPPAKRSRTG